eukprot:TRINITY_DN10699_c0_g1_i1.p1 TRINITY_DN10699_c0_g1~~TRINITY_DN10699_c0_g1_i1.p1  ORF type:complete len:264 (+),score=97.57 TRINITY_DN10699_c0_g1_i1:79-792(+)
MAMRRAVPMARRAAAAAQRGGATLVLQRPAAAAGRPAAAASVRHCAGAPDELTPREYVVHAAAPDRQGLMAEVASAVSKNGGDMHSSRATILGNLFSIMMVVSVPEVQSKGVFRALQSVNGLEVWHRLSTSGDKSKAYLRPGRKVRVFRVTGLNTNGIVQGVCGLLAQRGVSIINLASEMTPAPFTDDPMFRLRAVVDMPVEMEESDLEQGLDALSKVLGVDMWVEDWHSPGDSAEG